MDGICDWDAEQPHARNHILTTLSPPASVELCDQHYGPGMIPLLAAELGVEPGPFYAYIEKYLKRETAKADRALADAQAAQATEGSGGPAGPSEAEVALAALTMRLAAAGHGGDDDEQDAAT